MTEEISAFIQRFLSKPGDGSDGSGKEGLQTLCEMQSPHVQKAPLVDSQASPLTSRLAPPKNSRFLVYIKV